MSVVLYDTVEAQLATATTDISQKLELLAAKQMLPAGRTAASVLQGISTATSLEEALRDAVYVQECTPETLEFKQKVFAQLDAAAPPTAILASSTSNIPASAFTDKLAHRERCLVAHPVNPPWVVPVVEVVPAPWTSADVVNRACELLRAAGQVPVRLKKEVDGFVVNRLQYALLAEAARLVGDGIADPQDVDAAICHGLGLRWSFMGPFQTIDLNAPGGTADYMKRYADGITKVVRTQDNQRELFPPAVVNALDLAARARCPLTDLPKEMAWRDARLVALMQHKKQMDSSEAAAAAAATATGASKAAQ
jgi:3-hydroxyacyl-CoA dehydrogenase